MNQSLAALELLVVVNGTVFDESLLQQIKSDPRLRVIRVDEGNVSVARYMGLREAKGEYFCFLDDDDELLPEALEVRARLLQQEADTDVLVTNGFLNEDGRDKPLVAPLLSQEIRKSPGRALLRQNWFASPAALFRSSTIEKELFDLKKKYFEWTYLCFVLVSRKKRFHYSNELTYRKHETGGDNVSKSIEYMHAGPESLVQLMELPLAEDIRQGLRKKYRASLHSLSNFELERGNRWSAWKFHIRCLARGGYEYLSYTRRLVR